MKSLHCPSLHVAGTNKQLNWRAAMINHLRWLKCTRLIQQPLIYSHMDGLCYTVQYTVLHSTVHCAVSASKTNQHITLLPLGAECIMVGCIISNNIIFSCALSVKSSSTRTMLQEPDTRLWLRSFPRIRINNPVSIYDMPKLFFNFFLQERF